MKRSAAVLAAGIVITLIAGLVLCSCGREPAGQATSQPETTNTQVVKDTGAGAAGEGGVTESGVNPSSFKRLAVPRRAPQPPPASESIVPEGPSPNDALVRHSEDVEDSTPITGPLD